MIELTASEMTMMRLVEEGVRKSLAPNNEIVILKYLNLRNNPNKSTSKETRHFYFRCLAKVGDAHFIADGGGTVHLLHSEHENTVQPDWLGTEISFHTIDRDHNSKPQLYEMKSLQVV